jgi:hypothetical protein
MLKFLQKFLKEEDLEDVFCTEIKTSEYKKFEDEMLFLLESGNREITRILQTHYSKYPKILNKLQIPVTAIRIKEREVFRKKMVSIGSHAVNIVNVNAGIGQHKFSGKKIKLEVTLEIFQYFNVTRLMSKEDRKEFMRFNFLFILAHEWGHILQNALGLNSNNSTYEQRLMETSADFFAGIILSRLYKSIPNFIQKYFSEFKKSNVHSEGFVRQQNFESGFNLGKQDFENAMKIAINNGYDTDNKTNYYTHYKK